MEDARHRNKVVDQEEEEEDQEEEVEALVAIAEASIWMTIKINNAATT
jgi:hypothetical protein